MYVYYNNNYQNKLVGDCVIRALSAFLGQEWQTTYIELAVKGYELADIWTLGIAATKWLSIITQKDKRRTNVRRMSRRSHYERK